VRIETFFVEMRLGTGLDLYGVRAYKCAHALSGMLEASKATQHASPIQSCLKKWTMLFLCQRAVLLDTYHEKCSCSPPVQKLLHIPRLNRANFWHETCADFWHEPVQHGLATRDSLPCTSCLVDLLK